MKITKITYSAVAASLFLAATAHAQVITSIQFNRGAYGQGYSIPNGTDAGVVPVTDWNSANVTPSPGGNIPTAFDYDNYATFTNNAGALVTSTGSTSSVGFSISSYGNLPSGTSYSGPNQAGNTDLLQAGAATGGTGAVGNSGQDTGNNPVELTLNGLNPNDTYTFIAYITTAQPAVEASLSLNGASTQYFLGPNGGAFLNTNGISTFQDGASTTDFVQAAGGDGTSPSGFAANQANYIEFTGYTGSTTATLDLTELGNFGGGGSFLSAAEGGNEGVALTGVQIIDTPEPSTWAMMVGGIVALGFISRRRNVRV